MTHTPTPPQPITLPLTPVEAELVRRVELEFRRITEDAKTEKQQAITLILQAKQVPPGSRWSIEQTPAGLAVIYLPPAPAPEAGQIERKLELVPGGASEGNGTATEAGGDSAP